MDFYSAKDAGPAKGSRKPGYPPMDWLTYQLSAHVDGSDGGLGHSPIGELSNEGIYPLACIRMLCDQPVRRVYARTACHFHQVNVDNGVEDLATVTLEMDGGVLGTIALGRIGAASHASGGEIRLHVMGSSGSLVVQEARPEVGVYYRNQTPRQPRQRRVANENDFLLADDFAMAIDENRDTMLHVHASRTIFKVVEAALESARLGQPVQLPDGKL
jgi:predicted dehydrogenase